MKKQYKLGIELMGDHVDMIAQIGWDAFFTGWDKSSMERWANEAARRGLIYQSVHSPFSGKHAVSHMWKGGEAGKFVTDQLIECVQDCARFSIPVMVIHPFIGFYDHTPTQTGLDNYARVVEAANRLGVTLGFENVEGEEYLAALMHAFWQEPCCGFCLDTGHEQCYNGGKDMMALYGEKLCHTHFNDNFGVYDPNMTWENDFHLTMGDGLVDWKGVMDRIDASSYEGVLMCELTRGNPPQWHTHERYAAMPLEDYYAFALSRMRAVMDRTLVSNPIEVK